MKKTCSPALECRLVALDIQTAVWLRLSIAARSADLCETVPKFLGRRPGPFGIRQASLLAQKVVDLLK
jgi:hypothetical protein